MSNLYLSFSVVFPLFCMMALGYLLKNFKIFNDDFLKQLNNLVFKVFLPTTLFINIYNSNFQEAFNGYLVLFALLAIVASFMIVTLIVPKFEKDNKKCGVIIQGMCRSNYILFGIPITISLVGESNIAATTVLMAFSVPLFNALSVIVLTKFANKKVRAKQLLFEIIKNPLILASIIAFATVFLKIELPKIVESTIMDISKITTPLALMVLGGSFAFRNLNYSWKALSAAVLGKLVLVPLFMIPLSILFGFKEFELIALFTLFASPTAVSSYTMAENMEADSVLAGQIVVVDSICSILTIFVWITVLRQLNLI